MPKQTEEFSFAIHAGKRLYSEIMTIKVSGSDLYAFNKSYRGLYHISLHESGQLHLKLQGSQSLRKLNGEETIAPGKVFVVDRSRTSDRAVNPLNILIGSDGPWRPLEQTDGTLYEKIPIPQIGNVVRISVFYSNTTELALSQWVMRSDQKILKTFPVHNGSFYALVHEECKDPGIARLSKANQPNVTPISSPVDRDWDGDQYQMGFLEMTETEPQYILMTLLMNWQG